MGNVASVISDVIQKPVLLLPACIRFLFVTLRYEDTVYYVWRKFLFVANGLEDQKRSGCCDMLVKINVFLGIILLFLLYEKSLVQKQYFSAVMSGKTVRV